MNIQEIKDAHDALTKAGVPDADKPLAERIELVLQDLQEVRGLNRKLLTPEFQFGQDNIGVIDARGLIHEMVRGFDAMFRADAANNFITYTFEQAGTGAPMYVVTIQLATGKTPAERYLETAQALQDLQIKHCRACKAARKKGSQEARCSKHAKPVEPLPPEEPPEAPAPQPGDHLLLKLRDSCMECTHCGKIQGFTSPISAADLAALSNSFQERHILCPPPSTGR